MTPSGRVTDPGLALALQAFRDRRNAKPKRVSSKPATGRMPRRFNALLDADNAATAAATAMQWETEARDKRLEAGRAWRAANMDTWRAAVARWAGENRHRWIKAPQRPAWADRAAIRDIYRFARLTGMHVDHVIPLNGKTVSGLHVETNMQLMTPEANLAKRNRWAG